GDGAGLAIARVNSWLVRSQPSAQFRPPFVLSRRIVLFLVFLPSRDRSFWMAYRLGSQVFPYHWEGAWAHRSDRVSLGPAEVMPLSRMTFLSGDSGTRAFQPLQQAGEACHGVESGKQVHVRCNHPDLEHVGGFPPGDPTSAAAQAPRPAGI